MKGWGKLTDVAVKILVSLLIVGAAGFGVVRVLRGVWGKQGIDLIGSAKLALDKATGQFSFVPDAIQERPQLKAEWIAHPGITVRGHTGTKITSEDLVDRREYELRIRNDGNEALTDLLVHIQPPYPIENAEVAGSINADGVVAPPSTPQIHGTATGGGSITLGRTLLTPSYRMTVGTLRPKGAVTVVVGLNSWRDPRGKTIPESEKQRYEVPKVGPTETFLVVEFKCKVGIKSYFAPFALDEKTVTLGGEAERPPALMARSGWQ
jgi:hypothetical protein